MSILRFPSLPGESHFFTVRLSDPTSEALIEHIDLLRVSVALAQKQMPFQIRAACILPASLHMVWTLPRGDDDSAGRWRLIRTAFANHVPHCETPAGPIWQRRVWSLPIANPVQMTLYKLHCVTAPVRARLVSEPEDWEYSSIHHGVRGLTREAIPGRRTAYPHLRLVS